MFAVPAVVIRVWVLPVVEPQRTDGQVVADARAYGVAQIRKTDVLRARLQVACIHEHRPFQVRGGLGDRELVLRVEQREGLPADGIA